MGVLRFQVLTKDEGGRYTPFMQNYRPQLFLRTTDVTVALTFPPGTEGADEKLVSLPLLRRQSLDTYGTCVDHARRQRRDDRRSRP